VPQVDGAQAVRGQAEDAQVHARVLDVGPGPGRPVVSGRCSAGRAARRWPGARPRAAGRGPRCAGAGAAQVDRAARVLLDAQECGVLALHVGHHLGDVGQDGAVVAVPGRVLHLRARPHASRAAARSAGCARGCGRAGPRGPRARTLYTQTVRSPSLSHDMDEHSTWCARVGRPCTPSARGGAQTARGAPQGSCETAPRTSPCLCGRLRLGEQVARALDDKLGRLVRNVTQLQTPGACRGGLLRQQQPGPHRRAAPGAGPARRAGHAQAWSCPARCRPLSGS
jgi:hypothetical protein